MNDTTHGEPRAPLQAWFDLIVQYFAFGFDSELSGNCTEDEFVIFNDWIWM